MEYKTAIIGRHNTILGFKALGIDVYPVLNLTEAKAAVDKIQKQKDYAVVFISEELVEDLKKELEIWKNTTLPAVVAIPSQRGTTGYGLRNLKNIIERAVGSDITIRE